MSFRETLTPEERAEGRSERQHARLRVLAKLALLLVLLPLPLAWTATWIFGGSGLGLVAGNDPVETGLLLSGTAALLLGLGGALLRRRPMAIGASALLGLLGFLAAAGTFQGAELWRQAKRDQLVAARRQAFEEHVERLPWAYRTSDEPRATRFVWSDDVLYEVHIGHNADISVTAVGQRAGRTFTLWRFGRARSYEATQRSLAVAMAPDGERFTDAHDVQLVQLPGHPTGLGPAPDLGWHTPPELHHVVYRFPWLRL